MWTTSGRPEGCSIVPEMTVDPPPSLTPHADRQLLALHELRHRQLRTAFLHGRRRSWRDRRRVWPAVVTAIVIIALLVTAVSVLAAFRLQQELESAASGGSSRRIVDQHLVIPAPQLSSRTSLPGR